MENKDERYLNVTLKNEESDKDEVIISFVTIFKMLKKFLAIWLVLAIIVGILVPVYFAVFKKTTRKSLNAVVAFNYNGIEKGNDPKGNSFDVDASIKNPTVIEAALEELNIPLEDMEKIRQNITVYGLMPESAYQKIIMYKEVYEEKHNAADGEKMLSVTYFPTRYRVEFNPAGTGLSDTEAATVINTILEQYQHYFFEQYGYNQRLGTAITAQDYNTYDYAQITDVFSTSLASLQTYISSLSSSDTTNFRSSVTGYTFADLSARVDTLKSLDLDRISSYITVNNVTKDMISLMDYYDYKIETLARERNIAQDELDSLEASIVDYEKNTVIIYGEQEAAEYTQASDKYDDLIDRKIRAQTKVSNATQNINMYQQRLNELKGKTAASQDKIDKVEADIASLDTKISTLVEDVEATANDYFEIVALGNAYRIQTPAAVPSSSANATSVVNTAKTPLMIAEALLLVLYLAIAFIKALVKDNRRRLLDAPITLAAEANDAPLGTSASAAE